MWELGTARKAAAVASAAAEKGGGAAAAAVEKGRYADEEDYVKAGGRLLGYVRMQEGKPMDGQSSISDKVGPHTLPFLLLLLMAPSRVGPQFICHCGPALLLTISPRSADGEHSSTEEVIRLCIGCMK